MNTVLFDITGSRLYSGDASGHIQEFSVDLRKRAAPLIRLRRHTELQGQPISCMANHPGAGKHRWDKVLGEGAG